MPDHVRQLEYPRGGSGHRSPRRRPPDRDRRRSPAARGRAAGDIPRDRSARGKCEQRVGLATAGLDGHADVARPGYQHPIGQRLPPGVQHLPPGFGAQMADRGRYEPRPRPRRLAAPPSTGRSRRWASASITAPRNGTGTAGIRPPSRRSISVESGNRRSVLPPRGACPSFGPSRAQGDSTGVLRSRSRRRWSGERSSRSSLATLVSGNRSGWPVPNTKAIHAHRAKQRLQMILGRTPDPGDIPPDPAGLFRRGAEMDLLDEGPIGVSDDETDAGIAPDQRSALPRAAARPRDRSGVAAGRPPAAPPASAAALQPSRPG